MTSESKLLINSPKFASFPEEPLSGLLLELKIFNIIKDKNPKKWCQSARYFLE
jgi:hypothetical protein